MSEDKLAQAENWRRVCGDFHWVDAGSRGGFRDMRLLHPQVHMYSLDADATLRPAYQEFASLHHFPQGLFSSDCSRDLIVTAHPDMCSLLELDDVVFTRHFGLIPGSALWKQTLTPTRTQKARMLKSDDFFRDQGLTRIDFLKLDTQGTELEVLKGAHEYLSSGRISVIKTEVSFLPIYKNQCVFSDIDQFLKKQGFLFVDCAFPADALQGPRAAKAIGGVRLQEQFRGGGVGDAVYALKPDRYADDGDRQAAIVRAVIQLNQMGYVSVAFDLLKSCGHTKEFAETILRVTATHSDSRTKLKRLLKAHLPPWAYRQARRLSRSLSSPR